MMSLRSVVVCSVIAVVAAVACSDLGAPATCIETRTCADDVGAADAGVDGNVVAPPGCDLTKAPKDAPACVDEGVGVFASPTGSDGAAGTKGAPVKSLGKAVELAATKGLPRVYVCEGTYDANVEVKSAVSIFGGLACGTWAYTGTKPKLAPPKGVALKITKVSGPVVIEDLEVVGSADESVPGDSAISVFVSESADVSFQYSSLRANSATAGSPGKPRTNHNGAAASGGGNSNGAVAGAGGVCTCNDSTTSNGGNGASGNGAGVQDGSAKPSVGTNNAGFSSTATCGDGQSGANGQPGAASIGAVTSGALSSVGWAPVAMGSDAANGSPGQGGGGGGAKTQGGTAAGGGGAAGGCGGAGGGGGGSGGVSIALLSFSSGIRLVGGSASSATGGTGGQGASGQDGQAGGAVGVGACNGGAGGSGSGGSGGGGGAGGHSVAIAFSGTEPKVTGTTLTPGTSGKGGAGGAGGKGAGNAGPDGKPGADGKSQAVLAL